MGANHELYGAIETAIDEKAPLKKVAELIKRPLNELALSGAVDLSRVRPATRHPLGFYTIYLADGVCIHRWPLQYTEDAPFPDNTVSDIHQHSWDLKSYILDGVIFNSDVAVEEEPFVSAGGMRYLPDWASSGDCYRIFDAQSRADGYDYMMNTNRVARVKSIGDELPFEQGQTYGVRVGDFHTSSWEVDTATLMIANNHPGRQNLTLGPIVAEYADDQVESHYVRRHIFSMEETAIMAGQLATRLGLDG